MRTQAQLKELLTELDSLTSFISSHGRPQEYMSSLFDFACNVNDTISWALGDITTEHFKGDAFIQLNRLKRIAAKIEVRTGFEVQPPPPEERHPPHR